MFTPLRVVAIASFGGLCLISVQASADPIQGAPRIVDGDTVELASTKIRLYGDAPETNQLCLDAKGEKWACGIAARDALSAFSKNRP